MPSQPNAADATTQQRLFEIAEQMFAERGYADVRLRDIADVLGIKHSALYYHVPAGKPGLYVQVMERAMARHRAGMEQAIRTAGHEVRAQLQAVAAWLLANPPFDPISVTRRDVRELPDGEADRLSGLAFDALRLPLAEALEAANARGDAAVAQPELAAIAFISLIELVHGSNDETMRAVKPAIVENLIEMFLHGLLPR
jgi:AcrR family transcriptional regulator